MINEEEKLVNTGLEVPSDNQVVNPEQDQPMVMSENTPEAQVPATQMAEVPNQPTEQPVLVGETVNVEQSTTEQVIPVSEPQVLANPSVEPAVEVPAQTVEQPVLVEETINVEQSTTEQVVPVSEPQVLTNPSVEPVVEAPGQSLEQPVSVENQSEISEAKPEEKKSEVITSGTATEEEIIIDASKPKAELLDEYEIKKDVSNEQKRFKKNIIFIVVVVILIILFIFLMPLIAKQQIL